MKKDRKINLQLAYFQFTADKQSHDHALRVVAFCNGIWFGYWEGTVSQDIGWAWGTRPTITEFTSHVKVRPI